MNILPTVQPLTFVVYFDCPDCGVSFTKRMKVVGLADCPECGLADLPDVGYGPATEEDTSS